MSMEVGSPITVVSPRTGEVLSLDAPLEDLGGFLADVREHESLLKEAKNVVNGEVLQRMEKEGLYTLRAGPLELRGGSPFTTEYDGAGLRDALLALVDEDVISAAAVDRAVEVVVSYKPQARGINALRALGGRVAEVVAEFSSVVEKQRYVSVKRA